MNGDLILLLTVAFTGVIVVSVAVLISLLISYVKLSRAFIRVAKAEYDLYANECPICESDDVVGQEVVIESKHARQIVTCSECHALWELEFTLTRVGMMEF